MMFTDEVRQMLKEFDAQQCAELVAEFDLYDAARCMVLGIEAEGNDDLAKIVERVAQFYIDWEQEDW